MTNALFRRSPPMTWHDPGASPARWMAARFASGAEASRSASAMRQGELGPRQRLPAHGEKMLTYKAEQRLGREGNDEAARVHRASRSPGPMACLRAASACWMRRRVCVDLHTRVVVTLLGRKISKGRVGVASSRAREGLRAAFVALKLKAGAPDFPAMKTLW